MARGIGMSGRRRSKMLDDIIDSLWEAGYPLPAQRILDIRESEWDLGQDHGVMDPQSVERLAQFIRDFDMQGRLPIMVLQSGHVALEWDDQRGLRVQIAFPPDGGISYEVHRPDAAPVTGSADAGDVVRHLTDEGVWQAVANQME